MNKLEEFIKELYCMNVTTLRKSMTQNTQVKVFKSTHVNTQNTDDNLRYREMPISDMNKPGFSYQIKHSANPISLKNQTLKVGDVILPMRKKIDKVRLIKELDLSKIPLVVSKWALIIRTESHNIGYFIKSFLEEAEVKEYINNMAIKDDGKIMITQDIICDMPFPDIINKDLTMYANYEQNYYDIHRKSYHMPRQLDTLIKKQLLHVFKNGLNNKDSYNSATWDKIDKLYESIKTELSNLNNKLD